MNLVLLHKKDFVEPHKVVIGGHRSEHIRNVHQAEVGQSLLCGRVNGKTGIGKIVNILPNTIEMDVKLEDDPVKPIPLTLVVALPRPKMLKRIIESVTTLGVKKLYLINSWRVEKSFWQSPVLEVEMLEKYMFLGLEQSKDTLLPTVYKKRLFTEFVTEELPKISQNSIKLTAHPKTGQICPANSHKKTTLVVGPEGGFIDLEVETLEKIGFNTVSIGKRILKVETAITYLIARIFT
jgi:16S rRNA (uracil1498-N3)-methyltransferase